MLNKYDKNMITATTNCILVRITKGTINKDIIYYLLSALIIAFSRAHNL